MVWLEPQKVIVGVSHQCPIQVGNPKHLKQSNNILHVPKLYDLGQHYPLNCSVCLHDNNPDSWIINIKLASYRLVTTGGNGWWWFYTSPWGNSYADVLAQALCWIPGTWPSTFWSGASPACQPGSVNPHLPVWLPVQMEHPVLMMVKIQSAQ